MVRVDAQKAEYILVKVGGKRMLFTDARLDKHSIPKGFFSYDVRHCDEDMFLPAEISEHIYVNFFGTLVSDEPINDWDLEMNGRSFKYIEYEEDYPKEESWQYISYNAVKIEDYLNEAA